MESTNYSPRLYCTAAVAAKKQGFTSGFTADFFLELLERSPPRKDGEALLFALT